MTKKSIGIIGGSAAAAIILVMVIYSQLGMQHVSPSEVSTPTEPIPSATESAPQATQVGPPEQMGAYRINTACEMIYGFVSGEYPDGGKMSTLKIADLLAEYPDDFGPWKATLENNETKAEFLKHPFPEDFSNVLVSVVMKEFSINPSLKPIVMLITDPQGDAKLQDAFDKNDCQAYFDTRQQH